MACLFTDLPLTALAVTFCFVVGVVNLCYDVTLVLIPYTVVYINYSPRSASEEQPYITSIESAGQ